MTEERNVVYCTKDWKPIYGGFLHIQAHFKGCVTCKLFYGKWV